MSSPALEAFLARLYTDEAALAAFLADPASSARAAGLAAGEIVALASIDRAGLVMAARSIGAKRARQMPRGHRLVPDMRRLATRVGRSMRQIDKIVDKSKRLFMGLG
jgi:hypothetical protein